MQCTRVIFIAIQEFEIVGNVIYEEHKVVNSEFAKALSERSAMVYSGGTPYILLSAEEVKMLIKYINETMHLAAEKVLLDK